MDNKRRFSRISFNVKCTLVVADQQYDVELIDLALKGALVTSASPLSVTIKTPCALTLELIGLDTPLHFSADVAHTHENSIGLKFTSTDIDSMIHLRSIVESNSGTPEKISEELSFLIDAD